VLTCTAIASPFETAPQAGVSAQTENMFSNNTQALAQTGPIFDTSHIES
jgi:hypothetical protein